MNDIERAIENIETYWDSLIDTGLIDCETLCQCNNALEKQLNNGWTPLKKGLPKESGYYFVTYHEWTDGNYLPKYDEKYARRMRYNKTYDKWQMPVCIDREAEMDTHREITAWRLLPECYEE